MMGRLVRHPRRGTAAVVLVVLFLVVAGCLNHGNPNGKVVDRGYRYGHYFLTVKAAKDGHLTRFRVGRGTYRSCVHGSRYPACKNVSH